MPPALSIGIATYDDFSRLHMMLQAIRLLHEEALPDCELVIVNNNPSSKDGVQLKEFVAKLAIGPAQFAWAKTDEGKAAGGFLDADRFAFGHGVIHDEFKAIAGTGPARQRIFELATGDNVLVMDSHVIPYPGVLRRLIEHFRNNPDSRDLFQGPFAADGLTTGWGSFRPEWGGTMFGKWETDGRYHDPEAPAFEIAGQGLGFFACKRTAWVGFNPRFRGFGGEEMYIHEKFRQAGATCWCLPWFRMWHSFGMRHDQRTNPAEHATTLTNNMLAWVEVGWDLEPMRRQYLDIQADGKPGPKAIVTPDVWDTTLTAVLTGKEPAKTGYWASLAAAYDASCKNSPDFAKHVPTLRALASQCMSAVEMSHHGHGTVGLLAGLADREGTTLHTIGEKASSDADRLSDVVGKCKLTKETRKWLDGKIPPCDILFIDTYHNGTQLAQELMINAPNVRKFIVMHDTDVFGHRGDDKSHGLLAAIRGYLAWSKHWHVHSHTTDMYGLTVLARTANVPPPATPVTLPATTAETGPTICYLAPPPDGTGTRLMRIFDSMGVKKKPGCDCDGKAMQLNYMGVAGCRARYHETIGFFKDGQKRWGWTEQLAAGVAAYKQGIILNPLDPFPHLLDLALAEAEQWEATL